MSQDLSSTLPSSLQSSSPLPSSHAPSPRISSPSVSSRVLRPSNAFLALMGLKDEPQECIYCEPCRRQARYHANSRQEMLFLKIKGIGFYWDSKGRYPDDARLGAKVGRQRGRWLICKAVLCDHGHCAYIHQGTVNFTSTGAELAAMLTSGKIAYL